MLLWHMIRVAAPVRLLSSSSVVLRCSSAQSLPTSSVPPSVMLFIIHYPSVHFLRISGFFSSLGFPSGELVLMDFPQQSFAASAHGDPNHPSRSVPFPNPESQRLSKQLAWEMVGSGADPLIKSNLITISLHPPCAAHSGPLPQILVHTELLFLLSWVQVPTLYAIPSLTGRNEIYILSFWGPFRS